MDAGKLISRWLQTVFVDRKKKGKYNMSSVSQTNRDSNDVTIYGSHIVKREI